MKKIVGILFKYLFGVLVWLTAFYFLENRCVFDFSYFVEGLWTRELPSKEGADQRWFVTNLIGRTGFRIDTGGCNNQYIFNVRLYERREDFGGKNRIVALSSIVDVAKFKMTQVNSATTDYEDSKYKYILYNTSDGIYMEAYYK